MLKSLLCRGRRRGYETARGSPPMLDLSASDHEEDGFLLVGQTRSERSTVRAHDPCADPPPPDYQTAMNSPPTSPVTDAPLPSYNDLYSPRSRTVCSDLSGTSNDAQTFSSLPSLNASNMSSNKGSDDTQLAVHSQYGVESAITCCASSQPAQGSSTYRDPGRISDSVIRDVPFKLAPGLFANTSQPPVGHPQEYWHFALAILDTCTYDFSAERAVLADGVDY